MIDLNQIKLKKEGVATLQAFFIFIFASIEHLFRQSFGIVTGLVLFSVVILGNRFGRSGVAYAAAVTPPLAFGITALFWAIIAYNIHITKVAVDLIGSLASVAPWLILGALFGWYTFLQQRAKKKVSDARNRSN
jgi:energy-converting hydrogenase Eha subunit A